MEMASVILANFRRIGKGWPQKTQFKANSPPPFPWWLIATNAKPFGRKQKSNGGKRTKNKGINGINGN